jgi:hypothetical protein
VRAGGKTVGGAYSPKEGGNGAVRAARLSALLRSPCDGCRRIDPDRAERLARAVLQNIGDWQTRLSVIESFAIPGNKGRILSLMHDIEFAKLSLRRLANLPEDL